MSIKASLMESRIHPMEKKYSDYEMKRDLIDVTSLLPESVFTHAPITCSDFRLKANLIGHVGEITMRRGFLLRLTLILLRTLHFCLTGFFFYQVM